MCQSSGRDRFLLVVVVGQNGGVTVSSQRRSALIDGAIVAAIAIYGAIWLESEAVGPSSVDYAFLAVTTGVLSVRRRLPVLVVVVVLVLRIVRAADGVGDAFVTMALFVGCFTVAERCRLLTTAVMGGLSVVVFLATTVWLDIRFSWAVASSTLGFLGAALTSGYAVASQRHLATQRANAANRELTATKLQAESAVRVEREKLAADLHDVLAHHVNVTVVLAESGRYAAVSDQVQTFEMIASSGRRALAELDRILGLVHHDRDTMPAPDIERTDELVNRVSAAGFVVDVDRFGDLAGLDAATSTTLYRVVQEGLTNVIKHSPEHWARISLRSCSDRVEVTVTSAPAPGVDIHAGRGLDGLTERTALIGGTFTVANQADRFEIVAVVPRTLERS
jgi:signal transduction histidine kinase